jgi:glycosyltransferase involved in cell wall biosynthesis
MADGTQRSIPRVLHVTRPATGGMRRHVLTLLRHLPGAGAWAALMAPKGDTQEYRRALPPDVEIYHAPLAESQSPVHDFIAATRIAYVCTRRKIGILHFHGYRTAPVMWFARRMALGARRVITAHNLFSMAVGRRRGAVISMLRSSAHAVIANSRAVKQTLVGAGIDGNKVCVIYNGIGPDEVAANTDPAPVRRRLGADDDTRLVLCAARLIAAKGVDVLLDAVPHVLARIPEARFVVVGDGPDREMLSRRAGSPELHGCVRLLGSRDDVRDLIAAADCVAVPSREEGQGYVAVEAMACGTPWVGTRAGGLVEMAQDGETGLLVEPESPHRLADGIVRVLAGDEEIAQMIARAREFTAAELSRDTMIARTVGVYESVAGRR